MFMSDGYRDLYARRVTARKYLEESEEWASEWSQFVRAKVSSFLTDCSMDIATVHRSAKDLRTRDTM